MTAHSISSDPHARSRAPASRRTYAFPLAVIALGLVIALALLWAGGLGLQLLLERPEPPVSTPAPVVTQPQAPPAIPAPPATPSRFARRPAPAPAERPADPPAAEADPFADMEILSTAELAAISQAR